MSNFHQWSVGGESKKMRFLIITAVFVALLSLSRAEKVRFDNFKVYRLVPKDEDALDALKFIENNAALSDYDFWSRPFNVSVPVDLMIPPSHIEEIEQMVRQLNMDREILIGDVQKEIDAEGFRPESMANTFTWTRYHTLDEIYAWIRSIAQTYPHIATLISAGHSSQGRELLGLKLTFRAGNENRAVFMESNIHAREWVTASVNTFILHQFIISTDPQVRAIADAHDWYFFPVANPDGFVHSHTTNRMWRKTRVQYSVLCYGADPNRNWGYKWMEGGASNLACSDVYAGPQPFSEPCVRNLANYISTIGHKLVAYISFHSFSQMLLLPYGYTTEPRDNYNELMTIGLRAMDDLSRRFGTRYVTGNIAETIYIATGGSMDWVKATFGTPLTYTYELRDTGSHGFLLPAEQILPSGIETLDSIVSMFLSFRQLHPNLYV